MSQRGLRSPAVSSHFVLCCTKAILKKLCHLASFSWLDDSCHTARLDTSLGWRLARVPLGGLETLGSLRFVQEVLLIRGIGDYQRFDPGYRRILIESSRANGTQKRNLRQPRQANSVCTSSWVTVSSFISNGSVAEVI